MANKNPDWNLFLLSCRFQLKCISPVNIWIHEALLTVCLFIPPSLSPLTCHDVLHHILFFFWRDKSRGHSPRWRHHPSLPPQQTADSGELPVWLWNCKNKTVLLTSVQTDMIYIVPFKSNLPLQIHIYILIAEITFTGTTMMRSSHRCRLCQSFFCVFWLWHFCCVCVNVSYSCRTWK